jgi:3-oxoacyl-[acyl-carrier-protein] synthase II
MQESLVHDEERYVITGRGCVTSLGATVGETMDAVYAGESGIGLLKPEIADAYPQLGIYVAAPVTEFDLDLKDEPLLDDLKFADLRRTYTAARYSLKASAQALSESGIVDLEARKVGLNGVISPRRIGVSMGTGIGGADLIGEYKRKIDGGGKLTPPDVLRVLLERVATSVSMQFNVKGPVKSVNAACATGIMNIINGVEMLRLGRADAMIVGGAEAQITPINLALFAPTTALDKSTDPSIASRPFHKDRKGFVMGEGAGVMVIETLKHVLETNREDKILGEIIGYAETSDAKDATSPSGEGALDAMRIALSDLALDESVAVSFNAHSTGTGGDEVELRAIDDLVRQHPELVSRDQLHGIYGPKGAFGHSLGAAGTVESLLAVESILRHELPPSLKLGDDLSNMVEMAAELPITPSYATRVPQDREMVVVKNSFGFGGLNAVLAISRYIPQH